ncbi:glycosyltransferase [Actinotalea sp. Marseille-Q4924]|uniref:glycosyltransferase n=1 Tax=Actinotalea sp. Marseille-Q4924 TaxID=2866571 RepID=UPI001CE40307|nr:glycosyltransferase [Actinotalea sp. Marseille-Q4924]
MTAPLPSAAGGPSAGRLCDDLTVVVPVRNAKDLVDECLRSVLACRPAAVVVVDGLSTDGTLERLQDYPVTVLSDEGRGLPAARLLGAQAATTRLVALVDADVVLPDADTLEDLATEFVEGGYTALQAGQESVSGPGYWGQALVHHHRTGRSRYWFGLVCTIFEREVLLHHGFDPDFASGEDIELRWRLEAAGARIGVSRRTSVQHRYAGDDFAFARDQFLMDGRGLGRMVRQQGWRGAGLVALPAAAAVRGIALALAGRQMRFVPYYVCFAVYNYWGMVRLR